MIFILSRLKTNNNNKTLIQLLLVFLHNTEKEVIATQGRVDYVKRNQGNYESRVIIQVTENDHAFTKDLVFCVCLFLTNFDCLCPCCSLSAIIKRQRRGKKGQVGVREKEKMGAKQLDDCCKSSLWDAYPLYCFMTLG